MSGLGQVTVLRMPTITKYDVDPAKLSIGAHDRVIVQCNRCGEQFTREYRHKHQAHRCSTNVVDYGGNINRKLKWCVKCESYMSYISFKEDTARYDNLEPYCRDCSNGDKQSDNFDRNSAFFLMSSTLQRIAKMTPAERGSEESKLTHTSLLTQWRQQESCCYYTGIPLVYNENSPQSAVLRTIDDDLGYIQNNIVWVSALTNSVLEESEVGELLELLSLIKSGIDTTPIRLECKLLHPYGKVPTRNRGTDAGYDLYAAEDGIIPAGGSSIIVTGIALAAPPDYYYTIEGRSGLGMKDITPFRGIIDGTYCGELVVNLKNGTKEEYVVSAGDRIAQICLHKIEHADITVVDDFSESYNQRGKAGFGSSGR